MVSWALGRNLDFVLDKVKPLESLNAGVGVGAGGGHDPVCVVKKISLATVGRLGSEGAGTEIVETPFSLNQAHRIGLGRTPLPPSEARSIVQGKRTTFYIPSTRISPWVPTAYFVAK